MDCGPILVADGDRSSRAEKRRLLEGAGFTVLETSTGENALALADEHHPALILLAVHLPGLCGYDVCRRLRAKFGEQLPIVFVSGVRTEPMDRVAGLLVGADDYICKPYSPDELVARVSRPLVRNSAGPAGGRAHSRNGTRNTFATLTPREAELLGMLAEGKTPKGIAAELYISPKTVATHVQRILAKLGVHSRAEAVAVAYRQGLVTGDVVAHLLALPSAPEEPALVA